MGESDSTIREISFHLALFREILSLSELFSRYFRFELSMLNFFSQIFKLSFHPIFLPSTIRYNPLLSPHHSVIPI